MQALLIRVLSAALRRNVGNCTLDYLEQSLLNALTAYITGDGHILRLSCDLVDLIDINDASLGSLDIIISRLNKSEKHVLNVIANVTCLGKGGRIGYCKGNVKYLCKGLSKQCLTDTCGAQKDNV